MSKNILVYKDKGVGALSYRTLWASLKKTKLPPDIEVKTIDAEGVIRGDWQKDCLLFVLPGGQDIPYDRALRGKGNKYLKTYVESGGCFLGLCAGAYFAAAEVIFEKGREHDVHEDRELSFFPDASVGTLPFSKPYCYEGHSSACAAPISFHDHIIHVYYNGGCTFRNVEHYPTVQTLAYYSEHGPAIIECQVKKGIAILSGVHVEMESRFFKNEPHLFEKLEESESQRKELFEHLVARLLSSSLT